MSGPLEHFNTAQNNNRSHNDADLNENEPRLPQYESDPCIKPAPVLSLLERVQSNAWKKIERNNLGERIFHLDSLPIVSLKTFHANNHATAEWLHDHLMESENNIILYIGFEIFYELYFDNLCKWFVETKSTVPVVFSSLVKSTREYIQHQERYDVLLETSSSLTTKDWLRRTIVHMGSPNAMDSMLYDEDRDGYIQGAWVDGRLIILSPDLFIVDEYAYRGQLSRVFQKLVSRICNDDSLIANRNYQANLILPCDYKLLDKNIFDTKSRVAEAQSMEVVFGEMFQFISTYVARGQLDSPCYFETGFESIHLYKSVSRYLEKKGMKIPMTRVGLINSRNGSIGDSCHTFYATSPDSFPFAICGDTAALLAGGVSMMNIQSNNRYGVIIVMNNHGMAIEDSISKRFVDGHSFQYEYAKLERKRDIYSLAQLKNVIQLEVLNELRSHLWGISPHRSNAIILNIDIPSLRREIVSNGLSTVSYYLHETFGERFAQLEGPRSQLESVVNILYDELNSDTRQVSKLPVKIVGCSAVEYMEVFSQVSMTSREKMNYMPMPTDLLATRTLLSGLLESPKRTVCSSSRTSNFINSNSAFSVFVSNSIFGTDGLNNLISTQLEYGTSKLIHLFYDAAKAVSHYSLIGQAHRNFGVRKNEILPSLYAIHQSYEGQILVIRIVDRDAPCRIRDGLRDPDVKIILVDMDAPDLIVYNI